MSIYSYDTFIIADGALFGNEKFSCLRAYFS